MKVFLILGAITIASAADYFKTGNDIKFSPAESHIIKNHMDCYLDKGPCDDIGQAYKTQTAEAIRTLCAKCNAAQKLAAYTFNAEAPSLFPEDYKKFVRKFDPEGKMDAYLAAVAPKQ